MNITIDSKAFKVIMDKLIFLEATVKAMNAKNGFSKYMNEADVLAVTGLSKSSLRQKRAAGILRFTTATGKKIQYLRSDVESYLNGVPRPALLNQKTA